MFMQFPGFTSRRRVSRVRWSQVVGLETRAMLAATVTSTATSITVNGADASADTISVGINGGTGFFTVNGVDTTVSTAGRLNVTINGKSGADILTLEASLGALNGFVNGGADNDVITANSTGTNNLRGNAGIDSYTGGFGRDTFIVDQFDASFVDQGGTPDAITPTDATAGLVLALGAAGIERLTGTAFVDTIDATGETINVIIDGRGGADILTGGGGKDTILGGDDDDTIVGGGGDDGIVGGAGNDSIDGGAGIDTIDYVSGLVGASIDLDAGSATDGLGGTDSIVLLSVENVKGTNFGDIIIGNALANHIRGQGGDDIIEGLAGADKLEGNGGDDTVGYASSPAGVNVSLFNVLQVASGVGSHAAGDVLSGFVNVIGSAFNDILRGNTSINTIMGLAGNDAIDGEAGVDLIDAGANDDVVTADSDDDGSILFTGGSGSDQLKAKSSAIAVNWLLVNAGFEIISGSNMADTIDLTGSVAGATISGLGGNDLLTGGDGNDTINGGNNDDTIFGGLGGDILRGDAGADTLYANNLANTDDGIRDRLFGGADVDTFFDLVGASPLDTRSDP